MASKERRTTLAEARAALAKAREGAVTRDNRDAVYVNLREVWRAISDGITTKELGAELSELSRLRDQTMRPDPRTFMDRIKSLYNWAVDKVEWAWSRIYRRILSGEARAFYDSMFSLVDHFDEVRFGFEDDHLLDILEYELRYGLITGEQYRTAAVGLKRYYQKLRFS